MPEGDTIHRAAATLHRALAGRTVTRFDSVYPALLRVDHDTPLAGRTIESVRARGKHLLMAFSGPLVLHTHMRMNGSWHIYRPGERWRRPAREMRVLIETETFVAVGFNVPVAEFLTARQLASHPQLQALGPDLADKEFDADDVRARMRAHVSDTIEQVLLNQRVVAGVGNVLKSEVLFTSGVNPFVTVSVLTDAQLSRIVDEARRLMAMNTMTRDQTLSPVVGRRTTGSLDPHAKLWVYGRGGEPCRRCGTTILSKPSRLDARLTYWCPQCQAAPSIPPCQL
jgi:endonuclease-8